MGHRRGVEGKRLHPPYACSLTWSMDAVWPPEMLADRCRKKFRRPLDTCATPGDSGARGVIPPSPASVKNVADVSCERRALCLRILVRAARAFSIVYLYAPAACNGARVYEGVGVVVRPISTATSKGSAAAKAHLQHGDRRAEGRKVDPAVAVCLGRRRGRRRGRKRGLL